MGVFNVYVDESGKLSGKSEYTSLCGYVAYAQEWNRVALEWNACRMRWGVPPIHMVRIMSPDLRDDEWKAKKQAWGELWESRRDQLIEELSMIIHRAQLACVGAVVDANAYRRIMAEDKCTLHYKDSNVFAFHHVIMSSLEKIENVDRFSPISIIIDDDQENAFGYYQMLSTLRTHESDQFQKVRDRVHGISFCNDVSYPGIQMADMVAYIARRYKVGEASGDEPSLDSIPFSLYPHITTGGLHQPKVYTEEIIRKVAQGTYARMHG
jgi:hypothetical protein